MAFPILQFGTSRFLQAHADLFVSEALARGEALGRIAVVQTTASEASRRRLAVFRAGTPYRVHIRGLAAGAVVDEWVEGSAIGHGLDAQAEWGEVERLFAEARCVISNTADRGYDLDPADRPSGPVPRAFPAKLARLLIARHRAGGGPLTLFPCELVPENGAVLRAAVLHVLAGWDVAPAIRLWVERECIWANSLVDRIVSEPLEPAGAVAEPYALWAIEAREGLALPCRHPAITVTDDLPRYERLKLFILNLGHSYLAREWDRQGQPDGFTVREAMADPAYAGPLAALYEAEVLPVFAGIGLGPAAQDYRASVEERMRNPFLDHRLADIATNHAAKAQRRFGGLIALAEAHGLDLPLPRLRQALAESLTAA